MRMLWLLESVVMRLMGDIGVIEPAGIVVVLNSALFNVPNMVGSRTVAVENSQVTMMLNCF